MSLKLRPYQSRALSRVDERWAAGINRPLVKHPTGTGKTVLFAAMPDYFALQDRMLILENREELVEHSKRKLESWNPYRTVGVEMADSWAEDEQIVVGSVQTLGRSGSRRLERLRPDEFKLIVIDESHHSLGQGYRRVFEHFNAFSDTSRLFLGVTATPNRADEKGLGKIYQEIVDDMSLLDAIKQGWLSNLRGKRIPTSTSLAELRRVRGDFSEAQLAEAVNTDKRNTEVVNGWLEFAKGLKTVVFAVNILHTRMLAIAFRNAGIAAEAVWGDDPERSQKLSRHRNGECTVLINCQLLTEGYDDWTIQCVALARPTMSESLYVQMIGRGTRIPEGIDNLVEARRLGQFIAKQECLVLDFVDNAAKHSLVTLPTLFGAGDQMDLQGKAVTELAEEIEQAKNTSRAADFVEATDMASVKRIAQDIDMFRTTFMPEVIQISQFKWYKTGYDSYCVLMPRGDNCVLQSNMLDKWIVRGKCMGQVLHRDFESLDGAVKWADRQLNLIGGAELCTLLGKKSGWRSTTPSAGQLDLARRMGVYIPRGATAGDVSERLSARLAQRRKVG